MHRLPRKNSANCAERHCQDRLVQAGVRARLRLRCTEIRNDDRHSPASSHAVFYAQQRMAQTLFHGENDREVSYERLLVIKWDAKQDHWTGQLQEIEKIDCNDSLKMACLTLRPNQRGVRTNKVVQTKERLCTNWNKT